ncbi:T-box transcription factor tbx3 [Cichlidogyrus casuarinus]|uniref:T-box transcription factor tbx3 n=1 Tax=Cichlidogyrus casuarinus TaxID=1844966 RepID=A0ABD2QNJ6_9PLAT
MIRNSSSAPNVCLDDISLWDQFHQFETEMIVTKSGRRMFPSIKLRMRELDPCKIYWLMLEFAPADRSRYKFCKNEWIVSGSADPPKDHNMNHRFYLHPASPSTGHQWMCNAISFSRLKLTNNKSAPSDQQIILNSLHKYRPIVHIISSDSATTMPGSLDLDSILKERPIFKNVWSFPLEKAEFIVVTAYQNSEVSN